MNRMHEHRNAPPCGEWCRECVCAFEGGLASLAILTASKVGSYQPDQFHVPERYDYEPAPLPNGHSKMRTRNATEIGPFVARAAIAPPVARLRRIIFSL